ncbi:hypothetical protein ACTL6P_19735 [Endozoicomonas acroporae]|nr:hypothetical protein [Endozoicomonas acroporae]
MAIVLYADQGQLRAGRATGYLFDELLALLNQAGDEKVELVG